MTEPKAGFDARLLAAKMRQGAARTELSNYIRRHFDEMRRIVPESWVPWPALREFLVEQNVIGEEVDVEVVKRAWHREKVRRKRLPEAPVAHDQMEQPAPDTARQTVMLRPARIADPAKPPENDGSHLRPGPTDTAGQVVDEVRAQIRKRSRLT